MRKSAYWMSVGLFVILAVVLAFVLAGTRTIRASGPIIVNTNLDGTNPNDGLCTLHEAIVSANMNAPSGGVAGECAAGSPGADTIEITATGTIALFSDLPNVTDSLTVNGPAGGITISGGGTQRSGFATGDNLTLNLNRLNIVDGYFPSGFGGAVALGNGVNLNIADSSFSNNYAGDYGGAIWSGDGATTTINILNTTFYSNTSGPSSPGLGGAIYSRVPLMIANSAFYSNTVTGDKCCTGGGAIFIYSNTLTITNSTFAYNSLDGPGGAIYTTLYARATILNSTFAHNDASISGGAVFVNGPVTMTNTIVAFNGSIACSGAVTNGGYNIDSETSCGFGSASGSMSNTDPRLAPLGKNGGPTKTMALLAGSPAIDAVLTGCPPPATDQRGIPRPQGARCDIGAFEAGLFWFYLPIIMK